MDIAAYISLLIVLSYFLVQAADLIEDAFVLVSKRLGIRPFVIGFVILSMASSLPEFSLSITAAITQVQGLSLGNLIGGTIILLTLLVSINTIKHKSLPFKGKFGIGQVFLALILLVGQILIVFDGQLTQIEGVVMLAAYGLLVAYMVWYGGRNRDLHEHATVEVGKLSRLLVRAAIGVVGLIIISKLTVDAAVHTAGLLHIPASVIGLIVLALGTNLPEIVIAIRSNGSKGEDLAVGNFLGSASINSAILGMLALLAPYQIVNLPVLVPSLIILGTAILLFGVSVWTGHKITRDEGLLLLLLYVIFLSFEAYLIYQGVH